ncbi:MAG: TIGR01777 family protein [Crocinitomix sp.]|nr:TIGR01777 family protein [Crocinitomix sp.]
MKTNNILIAGGSGFLGRSLETYFQAAGCQVHLLTRSPKAKNEIYWNAKNLGDWVAEVEWADVLINMTGKSVDCRYTEKNKLEILSSRIDSTQVLALAVQKTENPPTVWLNAASATIYVHSETQQMTEDDGIIGDDFSMNVCKKWETEFFKHDLLSTRRVALRATIVMGKDGGAYPKLRQIAKLFFGGKQASGNQFISWIHIVDFCAAVHFIIDHPEFVGPVNVAGPKPMRNKDFMTVLRKTVNRPFGLGQPKWLLELGARMIGTESELLLKSRNVIPERLLEKGFKFQFETVEECLGNLAKK